MKKKFLIMIMMFLLTGCSVEYKAIIKENKVQETVKINGLDESEKVDNLDKLIANKTSSAINPYENKKVEGTEYYSVKKTEEGLSYKTNFSLNEYIESNAIMNCYEKTNLVKKDNYYLLTTTAKVECIETLKIENLTISLNVNYKVLEHNADSKFLNTYTWDIDRTNYINKPISIRFDISKKRESFLESIINNAGPLLIIVGIIGSVVLIVTVFVLGNNRKNNKI